MMTLAVLGSLYQDPQDVLGLFNKEVQKGSKLVTADEVPFSLQ